MFSSNQQAYSLKNYLIKIFVSSTVQFTATISEEKEADVHKNKVKRRFADISEEQFQEIVDKKDAKNTKRSTSQSVKTFREYLQEKSLSSDFEVLALPISTIFSENSMPRIAVKPKN